MTSLDPLRGVVAPEVLSAAEEASRALAEYGIPHVVIGGLAVGALGYPRATSDVDFLVDDRAFNHHGQLVTLRVPIVSIGGVKVDFVSFEGEPDWTREVEAHWHGEMSLASMNLLVRLKLKANRQKDTADVVELLKRGAVDVGDVDAYLAQRAPELVKRWTCAKQTARAEE